MRKPVLVILSLALAMTFSGCLEDLSPEAQADLADVLALSGDAAPTVEPAPTQPAPKAPAAAPQPQVLQSDAVETPEAEPIPTLLPNVPFTPDVAPNIRLAQGPMSVLDVVSPGYSQNLGRPVEGAGQDNGGSDPGPTLPPLPSGTLVDLVRAWPVSLQGVEYAAGCQADVHCGFFPLPPEAQGRTFTMEFQALVPAAAYFIDLWAGSSYVATYGDPTAAFGAFASDPIPGFGPDGHVVYTNVVPAGITEFQVYAIGGADFVAHLVIGETDCVTDPYAIGSPTAGVWATPLDSLSAPGAMWVYTETNGEPGLQRSDETYGTGCGDADEWVI